MFQLAANMPWKGMRFEDGFYIDINDVCVPVQKDKNILFQVLIHVWWQVQ